MNHPRKLTRVNLMLAVIEMINPEGDVALRRVIETKLLPMLSFSKAAYDVLSEAEYRFLLEQFRLEIPHFRRWLLERTP